MNHNNQIPPLNNISGDLSSTLPFSIIIDGKEVMKFEKEQVITSVDKILQDNVELPPIVKFGNNQSYAQLITGLQGVRILNNFDQNTLARFAREGNEIEGNTIINGDLSCPKPIDSNNGNYAARICAQSSTIAGPHFGYGGFNDPYGYFTIGAYDGKNNIDSKSRDLLFIRNSADMMEIKTNSVDIYKDLKVKNIDLTSANPVISDDTNSITFSSLHGIECNQIHLTKVKHKKNVLSTVGDTSHDSNILMVNESSGNKTITFDTPDRLFYLLNHSASDIDLTFTYNGTETITSSEIRLNSTLLFDSTSNSITYPIFKGRDFKAVYIGITSNTVIYYLT